MFIFLETEKNLRILVKKPSPYDNQNYLYRIYRSTDNYCRNKKKWGLIWPKGAREQLFKTKKSILKKYGQLLLTPKNGINI